MSTETTRLWLQLQLQISHDKVHINTLLGPKTDGNKRHAAKKTVGEMEALPLQDLIAACPSVVICQKCHHVSDALLLINYAKVRQLNCREICAKTSLGNGRCGTKTLQADVEVWQQHAHLRRRMDGYEHFVETGLELVCFSLLPSGIQLMKRNGRKCFINVSPFNRFALQCGLLALPLTWQHLSAGNIFAIKEVSLLPHKAVHNTNTNDFKLSTIKCGML